MPLYGEEHGPQSPALLNLLATFWSHKPHISLAIHVVVSKSSNFSQPGFNTSRRQTGTAYERMGVALSTQLPPLVINDSAPRLVVPPACPVCRDLKLELLDRGYRDHERLLSIDFQHILEQKKSCQTCRYILHMVLVMSKPLFARDGSYVSLFQSSRLKFRFLVGYTTRVMVVRKLAILLVFELYTPAG